MKYSFPLILMAKLCCLTPKSCLKRERKDTLSLFDRTDFRVHAHSKRTRGKSSISWLPAAQSIPLVEPGQRGMNGIFFLFMEVQTELCVVESHHRTYRAITCMYHENIQFGYLQKRKWHDSDCIHVIWLWLSGSCHGFK